HRDPLQFRDGSVQVQSASLSTLGIMKRRFIFIAQAEVQSQIFSDLPVVIDIEAVKLLPGVRLDSDRKARGTAIPVIPIATPLSYFSRGKGSQKERGIGIPGQQEVRVVIG